MFNFQCCAETATLKKCRDRNFTWGAESGKMAFCVFLCRNGVIPSWKKYSCYILICKKRKIIFLQKQFSKQIIYAQKVFEWDPTRKKKKSQIFISSLDEVIVVVFCHWSIKRMKMSVTRRLADTTIPETWWRVQVIRVAIEMLRTKVHWNWHFVDVDLFVSLCFAEELREIKRGFKK